MHIEDLNQMGSFTRFFVEMIAMFLLVTAFAFCLITVAYADAATAQVQPQTAIISH
jgi:hypothetical protein